MEAPKRILIVDDNNNNLQLLGMILRDEGFLVSAAVSGEQALKSVALQKPDLIITDLSMPNMDGFELCRQLKHNINTSAIPIIILTASNHADDEKRGLEEGAVDFISKPINQPVVIARVHTHLRLQEALRRLQQQNHILQENAELREDMENMSRHDLKGALTGIIGVPDLMLDDDNLTNEQRRYLELMKAAGLQLLDMINRSLDICKMERGIYHVEWAAVNMINIIHQIQASFTANLRVSNIRFTVFCGDTTCESHDTCLVWGEAMLLYSLFSNLIKNAIEASPKAGEIVIRITGAERITLSITNLGEVPTSIRERFFQKFTTAGKSSGTGLGTYSASLITRALGGTIELNSSIAGMTTVVVTLATPPVS